MLQVATVVSMLKIEEKMGRPHSTGESTCYLLYYIAVIGGVYIYTYIYIQFRISDKAKGYVE